MKETRILLVDENEEVRRIIKTQLTSLGKVAFSEASNIEDARLAVFTEQPDILITEIYFRGSWRLGMQFVGDAHRAKPGLAIVVFTTQDLPGMADAAVRLGARSFVPKASHIPQELADNVRAHLPSQ